MKKIALLPVCLIWLSLSAVATPADEATQHATVFQPQHFDMSPPLRDIPPVMVEQELQEEEPAPILTPRPEPVPGAEDTVVQSAPGTVPVPSPIADFPGLGRDFSGFFVNVAPPDTNMAVGPHHIVQIVNISFVVLDKSGNTLLAPRAINTLWSGFGGLCESHNNGDPIVQYDTLADRWVISQFALPSNPPFSQCVAVSTSGDPTGSYFRYEYQYPNFIDYPKMGIWPDGYYVSYNLFGPVSSGGEACVFDRVSMLAGQPATQQCFQPSPVVFSLLPADLDGPTPPPAGSPNYYVALGNLANTLSVWNFHVDWTNPANSTFTGPVNLPTSAFTEVCPAFTRRACVPQLNTSQELETLSDRLMFRLAYRNFGDHEALVANHAIATGNFGSGIRWYELRVANTVPTLYQQGTYAPDTNFRWMGSVAMNRVGDMALGFSLSGVTLHPAMHYTGRLVTDPLGQLSLGEGSIIDGTGSQSLLSGFLARWGDYSAMRIDPADDCTFWYTNEYIIADGIFNWSTRIGSFRFEPTQLQVTAPANATAGSPFNVTITVQDACNNLRTVHFSSSDPQAILPPDATLTNGAGTFPATFKTAGVITLTAADTISPSVQGNASVTVGDAGAHHYIVSLPSNSNAGVPSTVQVTAQDLYNNLARSYTGTVHFVSNDQQAVLPADNTLTNGTKLFGVTFKTSGPIGLIAADTVTPSIKGTGATIVANAAASKYSLSVPSTVTVNTPFAVTLVVQDPFNNVAKDYVGTVHFTTSDPSASGVSLPADYVFQPGDNGQRIFANGVTLQTAGVQSVTATDTQNSGITVSGPTTVTADAFLRPQGRTIHMFRPSGPMVLASFADDDAAEDGHHLTANIDWGDGTPPSPGTVARVGTTNVFNVLGSHVYAKVRAYNVKVTMTDAEGSVSVVNSTIRLFPPNRSN